MADPTIHPDLLSVSFSCLYPSGVCSACSLLYFNMLIYKGIRLNIRVDDVDVPEYSVGQGVARTRVTCWVPSQIGRVSRRRLFLRCPLTRPSCSLQELVITAISERQEKCTITVKVDGKIADEFSLNSSETRNATFCRPSPSIEEPFVFAKLDLMGSPHSVFNPRCCSF